MSDTLTSRFFVQSDPVTRKLVVDIPREWWSRFYEYEWASRFCESGDVALDAGCGLEHPFKFHLADVCREAHACDLDPAIHMLNDKDHLARTFRDFGCPDPEGLARRYLNKVRYACCSITDLPYENKKFDKVYCISVLEHLPVRDISLSLREFQRTLKDDGLIVLTLDYPTVDLRLLTSVAAELGLAFAGDVSLTKPADAVYSRLYNLYCFRAVLRKQPQRPKFEEPEPPKHQEPERPKPLTIYCSF